MAIDRRRFLAVLAAGGLTWLAPHLRALAGEETPAQARRYVTARGDADGNFLMSGFDLAGRKLYDLPLPARGHAMAVHPAGTHAVQFARRPGEFARVVDLARGVAVADFTTPDGRHFFGHGVYSPDGGLLYTTENDFVAGRGVIGVYDVATGYARVGELPAFGIGPHELRLLSDGTTLVVAIGGILTDPNLPRLKLNIPDMAPALAYIDRRDGALLEKVELASELHMLSIRHLSVGPDDATSFVMQYQGPEGDLVPLAGRHGRDGLALYEAPGEALRSMRNYCGSVAHAPGGAVLGISSPRGGVITLWDASAARYLRSVSVPDGCGLAPGIARDELIVTSGAGGVWRLDGRSGAMREVPLGFAADARWDNHVMPVG